LSTVAVSVLRSLTGRRAFQEPFPHWIVADVFPRDVVDELANLPFAVPDLGGVSGKRELHNSTRTYFDQENIAAHAVCRVVAEAFQAPAVAGLIARAFGTDLDGTYLRIEYAQDTDGFWLEPHSDLGVKRFTMLCYLSDDPRHRDLGTDLYRSRESHFGRVDFVPGTALVFIPAANTWHGFEKRPIAGVRKSLIVNYVTSEWRAREQLSWPTESVATA
jgi:hypothetical protein